MLHVAANSACLRELRPVGDTQHVAHGIVGVCVVHYGVTAFADVEVLQSRAQPVIRVRGLSAVAVLYVCALTELVVADAAHVVISV